MNIPCIVLLLLFTAANANGSDYLQYHRQISHAEQLIGEERYEEALNIFDSVIKQYDFVFLKHYKIATQLALHLDQQGKAFRYLMGGIVSGWTMKDIKNTKYIKPLRREKNRWSMVTSAYDSLHQQYLSSVNTELREEVHQMFKSDQWLAFKALFHFGEKRFDRYAENKFAPQSERHMARLIEIINEYGYPGEKLIGNEIWSAVLLTHHVSMTTEYTRQDTIYHSMVPRLKKAICTGEMSPYSYAIVYDWYTAVKSQHAESSFGYINELTYGDVNKSNDLRADLGMRSIEVNYQLLEIQEKTGMDFFIESKVSVKEKMPTTNTFSANE